PRQEECWGPHQARFALVFFPFFPRQVEWDGAGSSAGWAVPQDAWRSRVPHRPPSKVRREKNFNSWKDDVRKELAVKDVLIKKLEEELKEVKSEKEMPLRSDSTRRFRRTPGFARSWPRSGGGRLRTRS
ncbi:unnamed protein product, partial [Effrenium voratum]